MTIETPLASPAKETVRDFIHRNSDRIREIDQAAGIVAPDDEKVKLEIVDRQKFQENLNYAAKEAARNLEKQRECLDKENGQVDVSPYGEVKKPVILLEKIIDPSIPIKVVIAKRGRWASNGDFIEAAFSIELYNGDDKISRFAVREHNEEFVMGHREILPKYRGQKIAPMMIRAFEELIKEYAQKVGRKAQIDAYVSQLDVMAMFDDQGYKSVAEREPERPHQYKTRKPQMLSDVMAEVETDAILEEEGDSKYILKEKLYVQPRSGYTAEEQETDPSTQDPGGRRIADAIRVHFRKDLEKEIGYEKISGLREATNDAISHFIQ